MFSQEIQNTDNFNTHLQGVCVYVCVCYKELVLDNNRGSSLPSQQLLDLKLVRLSLHCNRDRSTMRGC